MSSLSALLTVKETAAELRQHPQTVRELIWAGALPWVDVRKPGAKRASIRVRREALARYIADRARAGVSP